MLARLAMQSMHHACLLLCSHLSDAGNKTSFCTAKGQQLDEKAAQPGPRLVWAHAFEPIVRDFARLEKESQDLQEKLQKAQSKKEVPKPSFTCTPAAFTMTFCLGSRGNPGKERAGT